MGNEAKNASVTGGGGPRGADGVDEFIDRWSKSAGAERANYQLFLAELCDLIGVPRPDPSEADEAENTYVFDKTVTFRTPVRNRPISGLRTWPSMRGRRIWPIRLGGCAGC
jgi:hypothetical protein